MTRIASGMVGASREPGFSMKRGSVIVALLGHLGGELDLVEEDKSPDPMAMGSLGLRIVAAGARAFTQPVEPLRLLLPEGRGRAAGW